MSRRPSAPDPDGGALTVVRASSRLQRRPEGSLLGGVTTGLAAYFAIDLVYVRVLFLATTVVGIGPLVYVLLWAMLPFSRERRVSAPAPADATSVVALGAIGLGVILLGRQAGLALPSDLLWPLVAIAAGAALGWPRLTDLAFPGERDRLLEDGPLAMRRSARSLVRAAEGSAWRVGAGAVLIVVGISTISVGDAGVTAVRSTLIALVSVAIGGVLLLGPWFVRLTNDLTEERAARIRAQAQEEFAAHLHDSVLQTLAIIQRRADDPRQVVSLARRQERELRAWLYEGIDTAAPPDRLAVALETVAEEVEADHHVTVSVVCVGDTPVDDRAAALVAAAREAVVNAAKHSGDPKVHVYAEVGPTDLEVFVRDRGQGFSPDAVAADRRGISQSIVARMERVGGAAVVRSVPGDGTEIELRLPLEATP